MTSSSLICVTPGDPEGIGPEICWKVARQFAAVDEKGGTTAPRLLFVGARKPFDALGARVIEVSELELLEISTGRARPPSPPPSPKGAFIWLLSAPIRAPRAFLEGFQTGWSIEKATYLVQCGVARALVTGPISKERLRRGGYKFPGHTEFLAKLCATEKRIPEVTMMLANEQLRVSLATTHVAIKDVPRALTRAKIRRAVSQTILSLSQNWGITTPRIAVAALNPHAGESGLFGKEEIRMIGPEIRALRKRFKGQAEILGPLPADTLFAINQLAPESSKYDAVVCMYHDQGLIPVKLLDFRNTVNVTLGLPIVRTSVDHGVGFDIAGTGKADPSSLIAAIRLAERLSHGAASPLSR